MSKNYANLELNSPAHMGGLFSTKVPHLGDLGGSATDTSIRLY